MREHFIDHLEQLVNTDSGSHDLEGLRKVASCLKEQYLKAGWHVREHFLHEKTGPLLEISNRPDCDRYDFLLVGHYDTVFEKGTAAARPFRIEGDKAYGPGVDDMKAGDLVIYETVISLKPEVLDRLNIGIVHNPDEEINSIYSREKLKEIGRRADKIFIFESNLNSDTHCVSRKGLLNYRIRFTGKAAHAGYLFYRDCASAINELAHFVTELTALMDREKETSVNVGTIKGGSALNVVAAEAELGVEMRFKTNEEKERIRQEVAALVASPHDPQIRVEITDYLETSPWNQSEACRKYVEYLREHLGEFRTGERAGLSDGNHLQEVCDIIIDGMGPKGGGAHTPEEWLDLSSIDRTIGLMKRIIELEGEK